ncbi:MAG TPA: branched-chain amino acid ABC transporter permease, partial [Stellaceae bacterium]|nr:branched-chain amino acid ABC transporter permease [Stellaceae bacterium]
YFGLGAYTYAVVAINAGESTVAIPCAILVSALVAAVVGAMMFYGRVSDVYMGAITLVVTLLFKQFMDGTAGDAYRIGAARLGGFNGMPTVPPFNFPFDPHWRFIPFRAVDFYYYVAVVVLLLAYLLSRGILASRFGRVLIGVRENEVRMELLGYNVPAYKTAIFAISAGMAGLAGTLYAAFEANVTPAVFSLQQTAEVIIWVIVGGLGTLIGPMIGAAALVELKGWIGGQTSIDSGLMLGAILVLVVLLLPRGVVPSLAAWQRRMVRGATQRRRRTSTRRRVVVSDAET